MTAEQALADWCEREGFPPEYVAVAGIRMVPCQCRGEVRGCNGWRADVQPVASVTPRDALHIDPEGGGALAAATAAG